jgi:uncharacterized protein YebE (UPF0316 family)
MLKFLKKINLLGLVLMFLLGFASWALWAIRTKFCINSQWLPVSFLVFIEEFLGIFAMFLVLKNKSKAGMIAYALGGACGAAIGTMIGIE